jgi:hypothetical protein
VLLVCKRWSTLCLQNPPQKRTLALTLDSHVHSTYLRWLGKTGKAVQEMKLLLPEVHLPRTLVSQALSIIAITQPNLRELAVCLTYFDPESYLQSYLQSSGVHWDNFAGCLRLFSQLETLRLHGIKFISGIVEEEEGDEDDEGVAATDFFQGMILKVLPPYLLNHPPHLRLLHRVNAGDSRIFDISILAYR